MSTRIEEYGYLAPMCRDCAGERPPCDMMCAQAAAENATILADSLTDPDIATGGHDDWQDREERNERYRIDPMEPIRDILR